MLNIFFHNFNKGLNGGLDSRVYVVVWFDGFAHLHLLGWLSTNHICPPPLSKVGYRKGKQCKKLWMEHSGMSINLHLEQMHKKAQIELRPIPLLFLNNYLHTHTYARTHSLAGISSVAIKRKRFCPATDTMKSSLPLAGRLLALLSIYKTLHTPSWCGDGWMDGWVSDERRRGGVVERWGSCTVSPEGERRPPDNNSCPHSDGIQQKELPLYLRRLGHPACRGSERTPRFLSLPGNVCSARRNNVKQGPGSRIWTNCFHLRPTFSEDALWSRVGIKR